MKMYLKVCGMYRVVSETAHVQGTGCFLGVTESYIRERPRRRDQESRLKLKAKSENNVFCLSVYLSICLSVCI